MPMNSDSYMPPPSDLCYHCGEAFAPGDETIDINAGSARMHRACMLRGIIGSVAHLNKRCSCYIVGSTEGDPVGMSARQAAEAAVELWEQIRFCENDKKPN